MFKKLIAPVQNILLNKGVCPGCGRVLSTIKAREKFEKDTERLKCKCRRVFIFNKNTQGYRRALSSEV